MTKLETVRPMNYRVRLWFGLVAGLCIGWLVCQRVVKTPSPPKELPVKTTSGILVEVTDVYDGDTFTANIKGWPDIVGKKIRIRINGIDAPEMRVGENDSGVKSWRYANKSLRGRKSTYNNSYNSSPKVYLKNIKRDKSFRLVADVYIKPNGRSSYNLGDKMIRERHAIKYDKNKKEVEYDAFAQYEVGYKCRDNFCYHSWNETKDESPQGNKDVKCPKCGKFTASHTYYHIK